MMNAYSITGGRGSVMTLGPWAYNLTSSSASYIQAPKYVAPIRSRTSIAGSDGIRNVRINGQKTVTTHTLTVTSTGITTWKWKQGSGSLSSAINAGTTTATVPASSGITIYGYDSGGTQVISTSV